MMVLEAGSFELFCQMVVVVCLAARADVIGVPGGASFTFWNTRSLARLLFNYLADL